MTVKDQFSSQVMTPRGAAAAATSTTNIFDNMDKNPDDMQDSVSPKKRKRATWTQKAME